MSLAPLTPRRVFFWMKLAALIGIALLFVLLYFIGEKENAQPITILKSPRFDSTSYRQKLPVFEWDNNRGQTLGHKDFKGQWTLINFWAHWCWPCQVEIPLLNQAAQRKLKRSDLKIMLVNTDKDGTDHQRLAEEFLLQKEIVLSNLYDPFGLLSRSFEVSEFPYHVLVDPQGDIRYASAGAIDWAAPEVQTSLIKLLEGDESLPAPSSSKIE